MIIFVQHLGAGFLPCSQTLTNRIPSLYLEGLMTSINDQSSSEFYDGSFYGRQRAKSMHAATRILPLVFRLFPVKTVADFGCGMGTWLAAARKLGAREAVGVEGPWVRREDLEDPEVTLQTQDLEKEIQLPREFDLVISLEVAEHLDPGRAASFVEDLTRASRRVLFSAAVPGQGGEHHVNEQWQSYWAAHFKAQSYRPLDVVRPEVWEDGTIPNHYKQNVLLYIREDAYEEAAAAARRHDAGPPAVLDLVHPGLYFRIIGERDRPLNFGESLAVTRDLPGSFLRAVRRRFPGGNA